MNSDLPNPENPKLQKSHEGEHHGDFGDVPVTLTRSTIIFSLCAALNSCNLGYDIGVSTEAGRLIQTNFGLTDLQREIFVASIDFWAIFGAFSAHFFTDRFGRRRTFVVSAVGFILGIILMISSNSYSLLMIGRLFVGLGVGVGLAVDPLYIAEVSPAKYRGESVTWSEIALNLGIVFGFSTGLFLRGLKDSVEWRVMFLLGCIMPVIMISLACTVMPETPRWLVAKNRNEEALAVLSKIYPTGFDVQPVLQDIRESIARDETAEKSLDWITILCRPSPAFRRMLLVGVCVAVAQQAVGIDAIQYYLLDIIQHSGVSSPQVQSLILVVLGLVKLVFVFVGGKLFDRRGRRPTLFISLIGMTASLVLVAIAILIPSQISTAVQVIGLALYLAFFSIGMGPGGWLIPSEVFSLTIRSKAMSLAGTMNRITGTLMAGTFLSTAKAISFGGFFFLLSVICVVVLAFLYYFLPETKGRSLEDMSIYFAEITNDTSVLQAEAELVKRRPIEQPEIAVSAGNTGVNLVGDLL